MNTTPSSTLHFTSTTTSDGIAELTPGHGDRPRSDQQAGATRRAPVAGERALVFGGGGGAGNAWEIGVIAGLFDAGLDVTEADLIIGTSAGSTAAAQIASATEPAELLASILAAAPSQGLARSDPAVDVLRIRWRRTFWRGRAKSSVPLRMRPTCAAEWVRRRSRWMRRAAPCKRSGAPPSPLA